MNPRKPRSPGIIARLPQAQRDKIDHWLLVENKTYLQVADLCRREFNFQTRPNALCVWRQQQLAARIGLPAAAAPEIIIECPGPVRLKIISGAAITIEIKPAS